MSAELRTVMNVGHNAGNQISFKVGSADGEIFMGSPFLGVSVVGVVLRDPAGLGA